MFRRLIAALLALLSAAPGAAVGGSGGALPSFDRLTLTITGTMANIREYEAVRRSDGVTLSLYDGWWDRDDPEDRETYLVRQVTGGEDLYRTVLALLNDCVVASWDGFSRSDPNVLDGEMFSLEIAVSGDRTVTARGSNAYPTHYHDFYRGLLALFDAAG